MPASATADYDARWGYRALDARRYERRRYGGWMRRLTLRRLNGPLVGTVCHPYTLKTFNRGVRRLLGRKAKLSLRLTRSALVAEVAAAGLHLERIIPVMPILSEVWVVVLSVPSGAQLAASRGGVQ